MRRYLLDNEPVDFAEFIATNVDSFSDEEIRRVCALQPGESAILGGGAAATFTLLRLADVHAVCGGCEQEFTDGAAAAKHVEVCSGPKAQSSTSAPAPRALTDGELIALGALIQHEAAFVQNDTAVRIANGAPTAYLYPTARAEEFAGRIEDDLRRRGVLP